VRRSLSTKSAVAENSVSDKRDDFLGRAVRPPADLLLQEIVAEIHDVAVAATAFVVDAAVVGAPPAQEAVGEHRVVDDAASDSLHAKAVRDRILAGQVARPARTGRRR